jgi:hypothetical protein
MGESVYEKGQKEFCDGTMDCSTGEGGNMKGA